MSPSIELPSGRSFVTHRGVRTVAKLLHEHGYSLLFSYCNENVLQPELGTGSGSVCSGSFGHPGELLRRAPVIMMEAFEDREGDESAFAIPRPNGSDRNALVEPLVRPCLVEITAILRKNREQVAFAENESVIEALSSRTSQKAFADGVRPRGAQGRLENSRPEAGGGSIELWPVLSSRSRMTKRGPTPKGVALRSC